MGSEESDEALERLASIETNKANWSDNRYRSRVGRVADVSLIEPGEDVERVLEELAELLRSTNRGPENDQWASDIATEYVRGVRKQLGGLEDEEAILVVVELPDESRFSDVFEVPQTTTDTFYRICRELGLETDGVSAVRSGMLIGRVVPVTTDDHGRYRIDRQELL